MRSGFVIVGAILLVIGGILAATLLLAIWGVPLVIIGLLLIIIGAATSTQKQKMRIATAGSGAYNKALEDLNSQLASGTITQKEYKKRKRTLLK
jgi:uncharacterized membrane protein